ncbi:hypothetical protein DFQ28_011617, partial [Apophysomyces sp. BC1034]
QGTGIDKAIGVVAFFVASSVFVYYTIWSLLMPFVDKDHPLQEYFPAREHAIRVPLLMMIIGLTILFTFLGLIMVKSKSKKHVKMK